MVYPQAAEERAHALAFNALTRGLSQVGSRRDPNRESGYGFIRLTDRDQITTEIIASLREAGLLVTDSETEGG